MLNIRKKRKDLGMSQKELAEKCGIAQGTLCDIEHGRCNPSLQVAIKIARVLQENSIKFYE